MPKLAANLTLMFTEEDFLDRFAAAAKAGFEAVEYQFAYEYAPQELSARLNDNDLILVLHNLPAGDWAAGDRGIACQPHRVDEFRAGVDQAVTYANAQGCKRLNCLAGRTPEGVDAETVRATFVENLKFAADTLKPHGIRLLIEPINTQDVPGFFLNTTAQALDIIAATGSDNIALQYDMYHMHIMEGDLAATVQKYLAHIEHIQISDEPGRHEPGTGKMGYPDLLSHLDNIGYADWVGCEYIPATTTREGLGWADAYL